MKFYVPRLVVWLPEEVRQTKQPKHTTIFAPNNIYIFFFFSQKLFHYHYIHLT
jgi:hypothetical protein